MSKKRKSPNSMALWQWGLLLMVAGPLANMLLGILWPLKPPLTNEQRGQAFGRGLVAILCLIAGLVMVLLHFIRRKKT